MSMLSNQREILICTRQLEWLVEHETKREEFVVLMAQKWVMRGVKLSWFFVGDSGLRRNLQIHHPRMKMLIRKESPPSLSPKSTK